MLCSQTDGWICSRQLALVGGWYLQQVGNKSSSQKGIGLHLTLPVTLPAHARSMHEAASGGREEGCAVAATSMQDFERMASAAAPLFPCRRHSSLAADYACVCMAATDAKQVQAAKKKQPNKGGVYFPLAACQVSMLQHTLTVVITMAVLGPPKLVDEH